MKLLHSCTNWFRDHATLARWLVGLTVLGVVFAFNRTAFTSLQTRSIGWGYAAVATCLAFTAILLTHIRWYLLVWALDFPFRLRDAVRIGFLAFLFNYVGPGAVGGDLVKAALIARHQPRRRAVAAATVLLDRIIGMIALLMFGAAASWLMHDTLTAPVYETVRWMFTVGAACGLAALTVMLLPGTASSSFVTRVVSRLPVIGHVATEFAAAVALYQSRPRIPVTALLLSLFGHLLTMSAMYCSGLAIAGDSPIPGLTEHFVFLPPAQLAGLLPLLPGGIGALEGALEYFYRLSGAVQGDGFLTGLAWRGVTIVIGVIAAAVCSGRREELQDALETSPAITPKPDRQPAARTDTRTRREIPPLDNPPLHVSHSPLPPQSGR